jgi:peptidoglycan/LPS O-acetylase OafA/YrhL
LIPPGKDHAAKIPQLDAVRGMAILLVMLHNIGEKYPSFHLQYLFRNGWMGVDLFFSLFCLGF